LPRARSIRYQFFKHEHLADLRPLYRLLFIGLWCHADRRGVLEYRPRQLKTQILPYDECNVEEGLWELHKLGFIVIYQVDTQWLIWIPKFTKHQHPHPDEECSELPPYTGKTPDQVLQHPVRPPPLFGSTGSPRAGSTELSTAQSQSPHALSPDHLQTGGEPLARKPFPSVPAVTSLPSKNLGNAAVVPENYASTARARDATAGPVAPSSNFARMKRRADPELVGWRSWDRLAAALRAQISEPRFTEKGVRRILDYCKSKVAPAAPPPIELELQTLAVVLYAIHYCPPTTEDLDGIVGYCVKAIAKNLSEQHGTIEGYEHMASRLLREVEVPNFDKPAAIVSAEKRQAVEDLVKSIGTEKKL